MGASSRSLDGFFGAANVVRSFDLRADEPQAALVLLKGLADFGDTIFVDTITEICKVSRMSAIEICVM